MPATLTATQIVQELKSYANPANVAGMARFGISASNTFGISMVTLRGIAKKAGKHHELALELWASGIHEARILAALVDEPAKVDEQQLESWVKDFDSWDVCDQCCLVLFSRTPFAYQKVDEWSRREEEYVKRAAFSLLAALTVHDKKAPDDQFSAFLPNIKQASLDERNYVKKAVNWALRQIGKRNPALNSQAIECAREIQQLPAKSARWIAADALRELTGEAVQQKLARK
ncbi:MAG TPA: DNA alkylation repair protein [Chloroflexia bacterium]|nr:DNA alkylation repair protein [Chloroflexia bacterium]